VYGPVDATSAEQGRIGRIGDGIDVLFGDVT
jgi:hypothetical protein